MALAIFDLDNTLIGGDSDHAWGQFLVEKNIVDADVYKKANDKFLEDYQRGELDIMEYLSFALKPLAENQEVDLLEWRENFIEEKIRPIMLPKASDLIAKHREQGDTLLIITATNRFVTERIADILGIDKLIATEPERNSEGYTGKVAGTPSFQEGKITRLKEWLAQNPQDLSDSVFYSDSHNDLPLMELVNRAVAVDPDETLRQHSEAKGWEIISLRS